MALTLRKPDIKLAYLPRRNAVLITVTVSTGETVQKEISLGEFLVGADLRTSECGEAYRIQAEMSNRNPNRWKQPRGKPTSELVTA